MAMSATPSPELFVVPPLRRTLQSEQGADPLRDQLAAVVERSALWQRAHELAADIARFPSAATQGTVRAIWESLERPYRAAMEQGLIYTRLGNPLGAAEVAKSPPTPRQPRVR